MSVNNFIIPFAAERITDYYSYIKFIEQNEENFSVRARYEQQLAGSQKDFLFPAHCVPCEQQVGFYIDFKYAYSNTDGSITPNWRERVECPTCHLNNRMRAAVHFYKSLYPNNNSNIYLTEQTTPMYLWFKKTIETLSAANIWG